MKIEFKVSVRCYTYNQASFIEDTLNGFCMQKTSFPFLCVIVDDASTDDEQKVITQYLDNHFDLSDNASVQRSETNDYQLLFARHKTNTNCYFAIVFLKYNHYRLRKPKQPYITRWIEKTIYSALCEGDDYWTDPQKLQRQVDFLDYHQDYVALAENGMTLYITDNRQEPFSKETAQDYSIADLVEKRRFPTASVMYRTEILTNEYYQEIKYHFDTMLWCFLASKGRLHYNAVMSSVYRRGLGVTCTTDPYRWATTVEAWEKEIYRAFPNDVRKKTIYGLITEQYMGAAKKYYSQKNYKKVVLCYFYAAKTDFCTFMVALNRHLSGLRKKSN